MPKAPKKVKAPKEAVDKKEPVYQLTIIVNSDVYDVEGDDLIELINTFTPPALIKNETNVIARKGTKTVQRDLKTFDARRVFGNKTSLELFVNNLVDQLG